MTTAPRSPFLAFLFGGGLLFLLAAAALLVPAETQAAPLFEQQYEKAKQDMDSLKTDPKHSGWREPWERLAQTFQDLYEKHPRWRNRPAALYRSALAMEELSRRSMLRQDAQIAMNRYEAFLKDYAAHVLADDALFGVARLKAERFNDFAGAQDTLNTLQTQYPRSDTAPEAKLYAQRLKAALEAAKNATPGKKNAAVLTDMRWESRKNLAVITLEFDRPVIWSIDTQAPGKKSTQPNRMIVDLAGASPAATIRPGIKVQGSSLRRMRLDLSAPDKTRLLLDFRKVSRFTVKTESSPFRIIITTAETDAALPRGIVFGRGLQSSDPLFRFATRTVMIDPGHGGKDPGTVHNNIVEREITLDIAKRVGKILAAKGVLVQYTRSDNTWVSLETRSYKANQARADMLLSIHVNANPAETACGLETYLADASASTTEAGKLAGVENANGAAKADAATSASAAQGQEARHLAETVHKCSLSVIREKGFSVRDGGVKSAPFKVLLGASMPGVMVEVGYCSNPEEAKNLATPAYRQALAEGLASGILTHLGGQESRKN